MKNKFQIWGIINLTPDSFFADSRTSHQFIREKIMKMLQEGADKIDIGAESSRPNAKSISDIEEWNRLYKSLLVIKNEFGQRFLEEKISIDSYKLSTIQKVLDMGIRTINDITGGENDKILKAIATYKAEIVIMHSQGRPINMQNNPQYQDVVLEISQFLECRIQKARQYGIINVITDVGIGFGKTHEHNFTLLKNIKTFINQNKSLIGISRKSFIGKITGEELPENRLLGTHSLHTYLAIQGINIIRTHDVKELNEIRKIVAYL